jgi:hypothetical protein
MAARWLRSTLFHLSVQSGKQLQYSVDELLQLANDTKKVCVDSLQDGLSTLDVLPLSWQATDWLVGAWAALRSEGGVAERTTFLEAMFRGVELAKPQVQLDDLKVILDAVGEEKVVVLKDVLVALKCAASMERCEIADCGHYLEQQQVGWTVRWLMSVAMACMPVDGSCSCVLAVFRGAPPRSVVLYMCQWMVEAARRWAAST